MDSDEVAHPVATRPFIITFSGIDGAGKTTQIESLSSYLQSAGLRVLRLSFWDDVAVWSKIRAGVSHRAVDSRHPEGAPDPAFTAKNNKHVRKWYLTAARSGMYMLDAARLRRLLTNEHARNVGVLIFDRYIYDQIANIYSQSFAARVYSKTLLTQTPAPDLAFVLDASPIAAFARKPEYPLEFMHQNRQNFLRLRELVPQLIFISEACVEDVRMEIQLHVSRSGLVAGIPHEEKTVATVGSAVVRQQSSCIARN